MEVVCPRERCHSCPGFDPCIFPHPQVDDPAKQKLRLVVRDDDFGWGDKVLGVAEVQLDKVGLVLPCF